jgi:hypothetical protein
MYSHSASRSRSRSRSRSLTLTLTLMYSRTHALTLSRSRSCSRSLGSDWELLHSTVPRMKHTRIVSSEDKKTGKFLFICICSCGCGFRYHCTCRLVHDCVRATLKFNRCRATFTASSIAAAHQAAQFWTHAANVATYSLAAFECLNGVPDAARTVVAHRYRDDRRRAAQAPVSRPLPLRAVTSLFIYRNQYQRL